MTDQPRPGGRQVSRRVRHYNLAVVCAVGYRVRNHRGTQFRQWAAESADHLTRHAQPMACTGTL
ncbi:MAG: virulence RhuM family protein [Phycisphaerae bacterium]|nr:virulence RhuM family protein [Phycisphaerae bacterium]